MADEKKCFSCGSPIEKAVGVCPECGAIQNSLKSTMPVEVYSTLVTPTKTSPKNWIIALLLCIFLGTVGGHRFYVGKTGTAILMTAFSLCGYGGILFFMTIFPLPFLLLIMSICYSVITIWWFIDLICICTGTYKDKQGYLLKMKKKN